jgi:hypothetical protein
MLVQNPKVQLIWPPVGISLEFAGTVGYRALGFGWVVLFLSSGGTSSRCSGDFVFHIFSLPSNLIRACDYLRTDFGFPVRAGFVSGASVARVSSRIDAKPFPLSGRASPGALHAEPPEYELRFAHNPLTQGPRRRLGKVKPFQVFHVAAAVANEMVMPCALRVESGSAAFKGHFPHQAHLHQVP